MTVLIIWECLGDQLKIYKENITDPSFLDELKIAHAGVVSEHEEAIDRSEKPEVVAALESLKKFLGGCVPLYNTEGDTTPLEFNQLNYPKLLIHCCEIL
jgi:hypothetical protein